MIYIFGAWIMAANINYLYPDEQRQWGGESIQECVIVFNNSTNAAKVYHHTCDEVAAEINKKTLSKGGAS